MTVFRALSADRDTRHMLYTAALSSPVVGVCLFALALLLVALSFWSGA